MSQFLRVAFACALFVSASLFGRVQDVEPKVVVCRVTADERLQDPVKTIVAEFERRTGVQVVLRCLPAAEVNALAERGGAECDVVLSLAKPAERTAVASLPGATKVAWKHPTGEPVWAAALSGQQEAATLVQFLGGPTGHRLWSESPAGFTIVGDRTHAEAIDWVAKHRVAHTYGMTAMRMLAECGGIREGVCIDIGCGTGTLDVELAKRSELSIIGLDIDADMKPLFEKQIREAKLAGRVRFVAGDAQQLPFEDDSADVIVSRGTLIFIPDIGKCLREVDRVLKPTGVAFLGGRYLYTPQQHKISTQRLREIVAETGIKGAEVSDDRGQWVKIVGPDAPAAARRSAVGPHMLAGRLVADYAIVAGDCLLICPNDGDVVQSLQQGVLELTDLAVAALYPSEKSAVAARQRIELGDKHERLIIAVGTLEQRTAFSGRLVRSDCRDRTHVDLG